MKYKNIILVIGIILFSVSIKAQETKEIKVTSFDEVKFEGSAQWVLIPSDEERVQIESENADIFDFVRDRKSVV